MILWDSPRLILVLAWMCGGLSALGNRNRRNEYEGQTDVDYPKDSTVLTSCDFNDDASPFCDFRQGGGDHSDWIRHRGPTPTDGTGPSGDYPSGDGYYIYLEADNVANGQGAQFLSPVLLAPGSDLCVQFWFYMYGLDSQNSLAVLVQRPGGEQERLWEEMGAQSHSWLASAVTVPTIPGQQVTVVFKAMRGMSASCDTALDNITISSGACPGCLSGCDFDTSMDLCGWTTDQDSDIFGWEQWAGQSDTEGTGPEDDFSRPGYGQYMLLDSSFSVPGAKAELRSPVVRSKGCLQLSFYYYMYGTSSTMVINAYATTPDGTLGRPLFTLTGNQGQGWKKAELRYMGTKDIQFVIQGVYGETDKTDLAVDSVCITHCSASPSTTARPTTGSTAKPTTAPTVSTAKPTTASTVSTAKPSTTTTSKPPVQCPPNSHYEVCGRPCLPSCQAPSTNCTGSCITGCHCDPGYVYHGRHCVPVHQCGCLDQHHNYYEPGQIIFGEGCSEMCRCLGNYSTECVSNQCTATEECRYVNGVPGCYPKDSSTCIVSGDPHYTTFDRRHYNFMGNCSYLLTQPCNSSRLPAFSVFADNEHRFGQMSVTYVKAVHVHLPVQNLVISVLKGGTVRVNGSKVNLPASPAPGVWVYQSGQHFTVATDFGLTVRYDGNHYMDIKVISDFKDALCGLCGDYNGNAADDFRTPDGQLVTQPNDFGNSWNTHPNCYPTHNETIPQCPDEEKDAYESPAYCGMLLDPKGPFAVCHPRVNPNHFFEDCVFDVCELGGAQTPLCEALEAYVNECQERNVTVGPWRNETFCPLRCPPNSHYVPCAPPCPESCAPPTPGQCQGPCAEGCVCDLGYALSGGVCVPKDNCGCQYDGNYYQPGEEFFAPGCQKKCRCEGGAVVCVTWQCSSQEVCGVEEGELGCHPTGSSDCVVSGDPHYRTFDGRSYSFMGTCTYTLARSCHNTSGPWFSVEGKNEERGLRGVSYLRKIYITVSGVMVTLMKSRRTLVDGVRVALPHSPSPWLALSLSGQYVTVTTPFGLTVRWDGNHYAHISVPSTYSGQMCGLCGNYDKDPGNDFTRPNGSQAGGSDDFGNSWQTPEDEDESCHPDNGTVPPCDKDMEAEVSKPENCGRLTDSHGPFRDCIAVVDPRPYFLNCVYDMCRYEGLQQTLCDQLQAYTDACLAAGAPVHQWRAPDFCPLSCPPNSHYSLCASVCPESCVAPSLPGGCQPGCVEGCQCDPGFVQSDGQCVALRDCGCLDPQGSYHPVNESWYLPGCGQRCVCQGEGVIRCQNTICSPTESCQLQDGEYGCHGPASPSTTTKPTTTSTVSTAKPSTTTTSKPPVQCPPNSHYEVCGRPCLPSCQAPSTNCTGSCITGCHCDPGYVYHGRHCVPVHQCGCLDQHHNYYEPGQIIFGEGCSEMCRCLGNYSTECVSNQCTATEECRYVNGVPGCYPKDSSTCIVSGDPHYTTFDRRHYNFMGNCSYLLTQPCNSSRLPAFSVFADNEHRFGQMSVTYVKAVHVHLPVQNLVISVLKGGTVRVNGSKVNLPASPAPGVWVYQSGQHFTVATDFGLTVRYDGNHYMDIKVISDFKDALCGLCGDYNGNAADDFRTPDGQLVTQPNDFGNSWNTHPNCYPTHNETIPQCPDEEKDAYESPAYCGMLLDPKGPFAVCHPRVNPNHFFEDCVFDVCELGGAQTPLCEALEAYVNECQERNVTVGPWRNETFCPLRCPPNSHYVPCAPPCPESCAPPTPGQCQGPCAEGCVCDLGYALSGGVCVPKDNCGCQYDGNYYQPGEEFFAPGCQKKCRCEGGAVVCVTWQCSSQEVCGVEEGELGCHPTGSSDCVVSGDPHYRTFDGRSYSFMGTCTYTLARSCHNTSGPWFSVEGKNEERGLRGVSYLRKIYITVSGVTVTLMKSRRTLVDGVRVALPHSPSPWLALSLSGQYVTVTTPFGLTVRWDGNHYAHISVPSTYSGQMCGLCGNYDKDPGNDFTRPNGSQAGGSDDFGNSWQTPEDEDESCHPDNGTVPPCDKDMEAEVSKPENCGRLTDSHGPFRDCIAVVDPRPYFLNCVYDMCRYEGLQQTLCDQLQAYTDACLAAGAPVHQWRAPDFCPLSCPPNSHYSLCASVCPESCVAPSLPGGCQPGCVEGCQCDPGFVQSDGQCVALRDCGCLDPQGSYHPVNESWYLPGCGQRCVCQGEGVIRCQNTICSPTESCQLQDGEYGCHGPASPSTTTKPTTTSTVSTAKPSTTTTSKPPVQCPPNSHYEVCGRPCLPSCQAPSTNCTGSCITGCHCDPGYVYHGRHCVPVHQCGCLDQHHNYYEPGQIIFGEGCSEMCRCLGNYSTECVSNQCTATEECRYVNGVPGCYPKDSSTCIVSGDPHYTTFDRRHYNFMGNCSYLLTQPCNSSRLPAFSVFADNEHRFGQMSVTYVKAVHVHLPVQNLVISVLKGGTVRVNGSKVNLPASPAPGVWVYQSGQHFTVATDFGLTVRYDGNHYMDIKVISDFKDALCGLCGDYNGNAADDFRTPDGQLVTQPNDFGNSWNTHPNCYPTHNETIPQCPDEEKDAYESPAYCGMLLDPKGPFAVCHPRVNPNHFFEDCVFDVCELGGAQTPLCEALEAYVNECQERNVTVGPWRNETFCPLRCPPNSHYVPCAPPCPESCAPPTPGQCQGPCAEGCVCDLGYALSGGVCVPKDNCGCQYDGNYYQPGEEFFAPGCQKKCRCEGGAVVCVTWQCSSQEVCGVEEGELGCHPTGSSDCVVSGDPHYRTFDGRSYSFMGTCTYTLARSCHNTSGPWFSVEGKNEERGLRGVSYLRKIYITVSGVTVTLMKSRRTLVDGVRVALPHSPSPWLALSLSGQYVTVTTPFGLTVRWDGNHYAHISVPSTYSGQMCGLCGNYDKDPGNDFTRPNGSQAGGSDDFGNSWQTPEDEDESCHPDNGTVPPCDKDMEAEVSKPENCGRLTDSHGPFRDCIAVVDPRPYFLNCIYDMCRYEGLQQTLCDQLQAYTDACLAAGAPVHQWRAPDFCPLSCPPNSHYSLCASVCPESCVAPSLPGGCQPGCVEGCQCDPGFVQSDGQCVALRDCGCLDPQGSYHPVNESWYLPGCGQRCVCQGEGVIRCQNTICSPTESCQLQDGEYGCHGPASPSTTTKPTTTSTVSTAKPSTTTTSKPPVQCPPNSHYEVCGRPCLPSCQAPSTNCTGSCITGCHCDPGYVYHGRHCVPVHQCGCLDQHHNYYEPGQIIFGEGCSEMCRCLGNYSTECVSNQCTATEECRYVNGVPGCYPKDSSTCIVSGDPHYTTFDRRHYNFMGNCSYLLTQPCNSSRLPAFSVFADNEHRFGQMSVTYVKAVHVHLPVQNLVISVLKGGTVRVNGSKVNLPASPAPGVWVYQSGQHFTVATDFGLTVRYDGNHYMDIKVISDFKDALCGLCGDYNGNAADDFRTPDGQLVTQPNDFGNSWNTHPNCYPTHDETIPQCPDEEKDVYESPAYCGMLLDPKGPFAVCHPRVNPNHFFEDCVFDVCELGGAQTPLCEALEAYVNECQERNVTVGPWRNETFCPLRCPPNSHYVPCAPPCPESCAPPTPGQCQGPCAEGCVCDLGYALSGGVCVPKDNCGCQYDGNYYQPAEEFFAPGCQKKCRCEGGAVVCVTWQCSSQEVCGVEEGELGCHPTGSSDCVVSGDPHYRTFDGRSYSFMGTCTYTLARSCHNTSGPWFSVEGKNEERGLRGVSYLRKIYITVSGVTVTLMKSRRTLVDGVRVALPHSPSPWLALSLSGQYVTVTTPFGLTVRWDGNHYAHISVPSTYSGQMCGLCGNYDKDPGNDFTRPNGSQAGGSDDFGNSWQTPEDEDESCHPDNGTVPPCDKDMEAEVSKPENCGRLTDSHGPFRDCIAVVDPRPYFLNCVYDMCRYEGLQQSLCDQLQAYTDACQAAGAPVHQWRAPDFCPLTCPPNSHYSLCASVCPESCVAPSLPGGCQPGCVEGCQCDRGFVQSDEQCVALRDCGCLDPQGSYHPVNESWYLPGCGQHCVCQGEGVIRCQNTSCLLTESCQLQDGEYGCQGLDSATCSATGDPHYTSYDGRVHHFQGACTYTLSKACNVSSGLPYFSVETENEHRGNSKTVSYVRAVRVNVYQRAIILGKGRQVQVDGRRVTLPVFPAQGLTVRLSGVFAAVETDFGLHVRFDGNHHADVRVPSSYSGRLCGLCGNYNSQPGDDNLKPDGKPAVSTPELGESWQVPDNRTECSHDGGVDSCDKTVESDAQKPTSCGMITDPQGVFQPCHSVVPPSVYFENCVYDQCGTGGDTVALCLALQSYAALCAQAGVPIDWRNKTFCPLSCPVSSHYSPCGTACPASCTDPSAPSQCPLPCVEGCVCDAGLVLSGDKCVPISQCGCVDKDNNYHPVGESWFPGPGCSERCHCAASNNISCEAWQCTPAEDCAVQEGVLGCHSTGLGVCHVAGDPHYFTFDSVLHTFMGTCTYTLVTVCNSSLLPAFTITAKNEERGQPQASYLRSVTVALPGATVTLAKSGRVLLDGRRVRTPLSITGTGASLSSSGVYNVLNTDFGLTVRFDGVHHLEITVPGAYYDKVCGMCGNFNGNDNDDNLMPNRLPAKDSAQLGNSWKAEGDTDLGCEPDDREDLDPKCTPGEESRYSTLCAELLLDARFGPCHALLPPGPFLHSCLFDLCEYQGMLGRLCDNVEAYAQACQSQGVTVSWRNTTFCPLPCPPNSHYSPCTPPCPSTCANLFAESSCAQPPSACVEGCRCDRGFVLSDGQCVPQSSCGCVDDTGEYHDVGDSWLTNHCERQCRCMLGGVLTCSEFQCSDRSVCDLSSDGIRYCKPDRFVKCTVSGDPHYRTFDGFVHHYQGPDTYVLTQSQQLPGALMPLTVRGRNARRGGSKRVSFLHEVYVDVYGVNVRFLQKRVVLVNGERVWPPMQPAPGLRLFQQSRFLRLHTDFGLAVIFDGHSHGEVTLPSTYRSLVGGLCGNYDGRTNNEYTLPDGSLTRNLNVFGKSWRVSDRDLAHRGPASPPPAAPHVHRRALEEDLESGFETEGCSEENLVAMNGTTQCGALGDPQGPFSACHPALDPAPFQESCVFDLCAEPSDASLRCASYEVYAQACQELGVKLATWREQLQCVLSCPANSVYSPCMSACPATCADLAAPSECDVQYCEEGCQCGASFALSGLDCVPYAQCGCSYLGRYYLLNENFVTEDCSQQCLCTATGFVCHANSCPEGHVCSVFNYTRDCYKASACLSYPCLNGGSCQETAGGSNFTCNCAEGYEGALCEVEKTTQEDDRLDETTIILIGVLVPLAVIVLAVVCVCVHQRRVSKKQWKYRSSDMDLRGVENLSYVPEKTKVTRF
ncbi:zonadhesin, like [Amia ocellicauda]|uniref:zonadhesin, like n=1 Tax=Amia ocellicauda TaxID=2972642 RepID=UPI003463F827